MQYRGRIRELKDLKPVGNSDSDLLKAMRLILKTGFLLGAWNTQWHHKQLDETNHQDTAEDSNELTDRKRSYFKECLQALEDPTLLPNCLQTAWTVQAHSS